VICSLALARLRTDTKEKDSNVVGMAQKLLLFWRKPAVILPLLVSDDMLIASSGDVGGRALSSKTSTASRGS
jgi:hypothetical protein